MTLATDAATDAATAAAADAATTAATGRRRVLESLSYSQLVPTATAAVPIGPFQIRGSRAYVHLAAAQWRNGERPPSVVGGRAVSTAAAAPALWRHEARRQLLLTTCGRCAAPRLAAVGAAHLRHEQKASQKQS